MGRGRRRVTILRRPPAGADQDLCPVRSSYLRRSRNQAKANNTRNPAEHRPHDQTRQDRPQEPSYRVHYPMILDDWVPSDKRPRPAFIFHHPSLDFIPGRERKSIGQESGPRGPGSDHNQKRAFGLTQRSGFGSASANGTPVRAVRRDLSTADQGWRPGVPRAVPHSFVKRPLAIKGCAPVLLYQRDDGAVEGQLQTSVPREVAVE